VAFSHGSKAKFWLDDSGGTLRDISAYLTSAGLQRLADMAETSVLGTTAKTYIPGMTDATIPIEGNFDATIDGYLAGVLGSETPLEWEYYPAGEPVGATKPKYSGQAFLTSYDIETGTDDKAGISGEVQVTGTITRAVA
jgi:hypothetical protein